jgi:hypothetical protein
MATPLTAHEAYIAGRHDFNIAEEGVQAAIDAGSVPPSAHDEVFLRMLANLWQDRIDRGELPPSLDVEKAG